MKYKFLFVVFLIFNFNSVHAKEKSLLICSYLQTYSFDEMEGYSVEAINISGESWDNSIITLPQLFSLKVYYLAKVGNKKVMVKNVYFSNGGGESLVTGNHRGDVDRVYRNYDVKKKPELNLPKLTFAQQHVTEIDKVIKNEERNCGMECSRVILGESCPEEPDPDRP